MRTDGWRGLERHARALVQTAGRQLLRTGVLVRRHHARGTIHPADASRVRAGGRDTQRVLIVGSGPAFGWGVSTHELGLAGALSRTMAAATGRGCEIDLALDSEVTGARAHEVIGSRRVDRYDVVLFFVGVNDALAATPVESWGRSVDRLIDHTVARASSTCQVFFVGIQPVRSIPAYNTPLGWVAERHSDLLNTRTHAACVRHDRVHYVPLPPQEPTPHGEERHRTAAQYQAWAATLAPAILAKVGGETGPSSTYPSDEEERQDVVDRLPLAEIADSPVLKEVVALARSAFRAESALLSVIGRDTQYNVVRVGTDLDEVKREDSLCDVAIGQRESLVVPDTLLDNRFSANPLVATESGIRFYAGVPVAAPTGDRIGALCIIDSSPRDTVEDVNLEYLHHLSAVVESEIARLLRR